MHDERVPRGKPDPQGCAGILQDLVVKTSKLSDKGTKVMDLFADNSDDHSHIVKTLMCTLAHIGPVNPFDKADSVVNWREARSNCH